MFWPRVLCCLLLLIYVRGRPQTNQDAQNFLRVPFERFGAGSASEAVFDPLRMESRGLTNEELRASLFDGSSSGLKPTVNLVAAGRLVRRKKSLGREVAQEFYNRTTPKTTTTSK